MIASAVRGKFSLVQPAIPSGTRGVATSFSAGWAIRLPRSKPTHLYSRAYNAFQQNLPNLARLFGIPKGNVSTTNFPHRLASIQQRLSFPSRVALSRPLRAPGMPRPQTLVRPVHEVGLGIARKFSSQSTFRHIVENASIKSRAFWEVDWTFPPDDIRYKQIYRRKPSQGTVLNSRYSNGGPPSYTHDLNRYFSLPAIKESTIVDLSLEPVDTGIVMPSAILRDTLQLLPFQNILVDHIRFQSRATEVGAILAALDEANAWADGITVHALVDPSGLCTNLRLIFQGWSLEQVQSLLGPLSDVPGCNIQGAAAPGNCFPQYNDTPSVEVVQPLEFIMPNPFNHDHQGDGMDDQTSDHEFDDSLSMLSLTSSCDMTGEWSIDYHTQNQFVLLSSDFLSKMSFSE